MKTIAKLRVPFMVLIYVLFFGHVALWYLGKVNSVGHLGFGNFFLTLQTGLVSAGTVFSIIVFLLSLVLGGVFCGWACHWGIIQDFSYWVFERIGIKPKMIRIESTIIPWIWFTVILGQLVFAWIAFGLPKGFSMELGNPEVWSGVPRSIFLICITMVTNSFFLIFLLGKRAFCRTICSFRLWFNWFNHIAPLKMVRKKECKHCGNCRNECLMGIDVVGEMDSFGHVKNKSCLRCMNCSLVCPNSAPQAAFWSINPEVNPEKEFQPLPLHIDSDSSLLISAVSAITLVFFCAFWGGSISMSAGFCFGVIIWRALSQKNISSFEALAIPLLLVSLLYRVDLNDFTSLIKGVFLILIFLSITKFVGFSAWEKFLALDPKSVKPSKFVLVPFVLFALIFLGRESLLSWELFKEQAAKKEGNFSYLSGILEFSLPYKPDKAKSLFELGLAREAEGNFEKAAEALKESANLEPTPAVFHNLYQVLRLQKKNNEALETIKSGLLKFPSASLLLHDMGTLEIELNQLSNAEQTFRTILTDNSVDYEAHLNLGILLSIGQKFREAEIEFQIVKIKKPAILGSYLANFLSMLNRFQEAEEEYKEAISRHPNDPTIHFSLATLYARQEKIIPAIQCWEKVLEIDPQNSEAKINIARANERLGNSSRTR